MWQSVTSVSKGAAGFMNLFPQWQAQNQLLDSEMIFRTWKSLELKTEGWKKLGFMLWNLVYNLCRKADVSQGENTTCRSNAVGYTRSTISSQGRRLWSWLSLPYWEHWIARQTQQQQPRSSHKNTWHVQQHHPNTQCTVVVSLLARSFFLVWTVYFTNLVYMIKEKL